MRLQAESTPISQHVKPAKLPFKERMLEAAKKKMLEFMVSYSFLLPNYAAPTPITFTDAPAIRLSYVIENEQLQQHLQTLRNPAATEQQKLDALSGISTIYLQQGGTLTTDDISQTITTMNGFVLGNHSLSIQLLSAGCATITTIFNSPANLEAGISAEQLKTSIQEIGIFVSSNPQSEGACSSGMLATNSIFGRNLPLLIDNECVATGLETARIAMENGSETPQTYAISFTGALFRTIYNAAITSQDMAKGMGILTSALPSPSFNVRQGALFYLKTSLQTFIDFRADVSLTALQSALTVVSNYLITEPDAYLKEQAIAALQAGINHKTAQFESGFLSNAMAKLKQIADNASLPPGTRTAAGGALLNGCFIKPEFFDSSPYSALFNLSAASARLMLLNSPDWTGWGVDILGHTAPLESQVLDYRRMYSIAKANANAPAISAIFSTTGITYYNEFPQALLQHLYDNRNNLTGKAPLFMVMTTHRGGTEMGQFITQDYLDKFDMRPIQPGSDTVMHSMLVSTSQRLGIEPKDVNPNGAKFRMLTVSGHADANLIYLQPFITREDATLLQDMGRYFADGSRGFIFGCESMGIANPPHGLPLGEMMALNMKMQLFGAQVPMGGVDSTQFSFENGQWLISDIYLSGSVPRTSADYGNVSPLPMSEWTATRVNSSIQLNWSAQSNGNTEGFDVIRSTDGKTFERIGKIPKGNTSSYSFTDASPPQSDSLAYCITRRDGAPTHGDGSLNYSFSTSTPLTVGGIIGIGNTQEQPAKFELLQNYPNPFNAQTIISYSIPKDEKVTLTLYNILGQQIATPVNTLQKAGQHSITLDASSLASGIYFYTIEAGDSKGTKKMALVK